MKAVLEKEITDLLTQYNHTGELVQEVLGSAEKAARDLAAVSGESIETANAAVLEATKVQIEFLAAHPEVQAVIVGDDGLIKEIRETGRNAQGVKLIDLRDGEVLQGIAPVVSDDDEEATEEA